MKKIVILIAASLMLLASASVCIYCGVSSRNIPSKYATLFMAQLESLASGESDYYCSSGGPGSTACSTSVSGTIDGTGLGTGCSVECSPGYYACCNAMENKCQCRSN